MGAYLSQPNTEKISEEGANNKLSFGGSNCQGWRISQEDAHNAILDFDENTSLFAVYDGHGGSEVSAYCAMKFPEFLKEVAAYKDGDLDKALKDAFLGFDDTLMLPNVIEELKLLAKKNPDAETAESDVESDENLGELCQEAHMPLKDVLEKYKGTNAAPNPEIARLQASVAATQKPISPYLRGRKPGAADGAGGSAASGSNGAGCSSSSSSSSMEPQASSSSSRRLDVDDATVSSSSSRDDIGGGTSKKSNEAESSSTTTTWAGSNGSKNDIPDSSSTTKSTEELKATLTNSDSSEVSQSISDGKQQSSHPQPRSIAEVATTNGDIGGSEATTVAAAVKPSTVDDEAKIESTSSSTAKVEGVSSSGVYENGEVSSNSNGNGPTTAAASNSISSTEKVSDSSSDDSDEEANFEENSDTEDGEEDPDLEEIETEEEEDEEQLTEEDEEFMNNMVDEPGKDSGCTAVVALLRGNELYVANAGDSRCVVCRDGKAVEMSFDHKPEDQIEFDRIKNAGGRVTLDGRVNGGLNLSRAIGDHGYKMNKTLPAEKQMISALPDIKKLTLTPEDEFMVLACDGIWNFMSSDEVVEFVRLKLKERPDIKLTKICEELFDFCLAPNTMGDGTGCDNMTAIIVRFNKTTSGVKRSIEEDGEIIADSGESDAKRQKKNDDEPTQAPIIDTSS